MTLPPMADLVELVKATGPGALDRYIPCIDAYAGAGDIAAWAEVKVESIYQDRSHGRGAWPDPVPLPGRSIVWTYRQVVEHRARR